MNGYKIVLLKAILCFIGCRKVNGYAPEYVDFESQGVETGYFQTDERAGDIPETVDIFD